MYKFNIKLSFILYIYCYSYFCVFFVISIYILLLVALFFQIIFLIHSFGRFVTNKFLLHKAHNCLVYLGWQKTQNCKFASKWRHVFVLYWVIFQTTWNAGYWLKNTFLQFVKCNNVCNIVLHACWNVQKLIKNVKIKSLPVRAPKFRYLYLCWRKYILCVKKSQSGCGAPLLHCRNCYYSCRGDVNISTCCYMCPSI